MNKDGSMIKTRGFAVQDFSKHKFGKTITLKYDGTKFRPMYLANDSSAQSPDLLQLDASS